MAFFYFLGADPDLSHDFLNPADGPEAIQLNRKLVLSALSVLCCFGEKRKEDAEGYRKLWAKEIWLVEQLWKHVPREIQSQVLIDLEVNETDPDFCFYKAVFGEAPKPVPSLP